MGLLGSEPACRVRTFGRRRAPTRGWCELLYRGRGDAACRERRPLDLPQWTRSSNHAIAARAARRVVTRMQLRIEHLSKTYPNGTRALENVSLTIDPGID